MKIVKPGKVPGDRLLRGTCRTCGCVVECKQSEARYEGRDPREPGAWYVPCPTAGCGQEDLWLNQVGKS